MQSSQQRLRAHLKQLTDQANDFLQKKRYEEARSAATQAINYNKNSACAYALRAAAFYGLQNYPAAIIDARKAIDIKKDYVFAYEVLIKSKIKNAGSTSADVKKLIDELLALNANNKVAKAAAASLVEQIKSKKRELEDGEIPETTNIANVHPNLPSKKLKKTQTESIPITSQPPTALNNRQNETPSINTPEKFGPLEELKIELTKQEKERKKLEHYMRLFTHECEKANAFTTFMKNKTGSIDKFLSEHDEPVSDNEENISDNLKVIKTEVRNKRAENLQLIPQMQEAKKLITRIDEEQKKISSVMDEFNQKKIQQNLFTSSQDKTTTLVHKQSENSKQSLRRNTNS